jgi:hypothetical protein
VRSRARPHDHRDGDRDGFLDHGRDLDRLQRQLELARLGLAVVEHVVDQGEQASAGQRDAVGILHHFLAERILGDHLGVADHRIQRRAQLMAQVGEEQPLGCTVQFGLAPGCIEFPDHALEPAQGGVEVARLVLEQRLGLLTCSPLAREHPPQQLDLVATPRVRHVRLSSKTASQAPPGPAAERAKS